MARSRKTGPKTRSGAAGGPDYWLTLVPAYGRDYATPEAVLAAWLADKDFKVMDVSCPFDGKYCNRQDLAAYGLQRPGKDGKLEKVCDGKDVTLKIRFARLEEFVLVKADAIVTETEANEEGRP